MRRERWKRSKERGILPHAEASLHNKGKWRGGNRTLLEVRCARITVHMWGKDEYRQRGEESGLARDTGEGRGGRESDGEGKRGGRSAEREHRKVITQIQLTSDCCSIAVILHS